MVYDRVSENLTLAAQMEIQRYSDQKERNGELSLSRLNVQFLKATSDNSEFVDSFMFELQREENQS